MIKKRILVVDDEEDIIKLIKNVLERANYTVLYEYGSETALQRVTAHPPDLIILDLNLPGIGGMELCRIIKNTPATRHIPILMLSMKSAMEDKIAGLKFGADDYMTKPFHSGELLARVEAILRRSKKTEEHEPVVTDGKITVDLDSRIVQIKGKKIELRPKEFDLLVLLMKQKGRVLNRVYIMESILGREYFGNYRVIDAHVKNLRKQMGSESVRIKTIKDIGYLFE
ncbi:MAG: response regulator [Elusimicrobia bacterium]|nr:response regulator [Elusimicrobiota bacterium]MBD3411880.1 response regulator [Elusimicrobiota bacterium]